MATLSINLNSKTGKVWYVDANGDIASESISDTASITCPNGTIVCLLANNEDFATMTATATGADVEQAVSEIYTNGNGTFYAVVPTADSASVEIAYT